MGFLNSIFGNSKNTNASKNNFNWIALTDITQLNEVETKSNEKPVVIFKHSTRCSISRAALKRFEKEFDLKDTVGTYFLDLIEHRDISTEIVNRFKVHHESPQLILIKNEKVIYNISHSDIDAGDLKNHL